MNSPSNDLGMTRGSRWIAMLVIGAVVVAVIVVLVLVDQGELSKGWAYAVVPIAIVAAASTRVLTIFKAAAESKRPHPARPALRATGSGRCARPGSQRRQRARSDPRTHPPGHPEEHRLSPATGLKREAIPGTAEALEV